MDEQKLQLLITKDGSHSLRNDWLEETYHSVHGAMTESKHVFINAGLHYFPFEKKINLLEIGFGTGLNVLLTLLEEEYDVHYHSLEAYPLEKIIYSQLNYHLHLNVAREKFLQVHECEWGREAELGKNFILLKQRTKMESVNFTEKYYDLIYFDAFAPRVQPELWTKEIFEKIFRSMKDGGVLVTYCAKGEVKRNLKAAGFEVETLQGPPGKREMTRAIKK